MKAVWTKSRRGGKGSLEQRRGHTFVGKVTSLLFNTLLVTALPPGARPILLAPPVSPVSQVAQSSQIR